MSKHSARELNSSATPRLLANAVPYALALAITIVLGLASRRYADSLPSWLANNAGDALWASMVYFGFRLLRIGRSPLLAAICAYAFSCAIECSQLYQSGWINGIRDTTIGGLVLGHGFLAVDLLRYAVGIVAGLLMDRCLLGQAFVKR